MSMISGQIDKLRNAAEFYDGSQAANLMRDAADTIWQLRDDLQRANAENAKLRKLARLMHGELVSCEDNGYICGGHKFDKRVRELGILEEVGQ